MENCITLTFGAKAVPDGGALVQVGDVLRQYRQAGHALIAVVGALPGVTEMLRESIQISNYSRVQNKLLSSHTSAARKLVQQSQDRAMLIQDIADILESYNWMGRTMINRSPTPPEAATILAVGERLTARLLAGHLQHLGIRAVHMTDAIVTDETYIDAPPDMAATRQRCTEKLLPLLDEGYIVIVGSGSGMTPSGKASRLPGEGPYLVGSLLAAFSEATSLCCMTSSDGILSADPTLVTQAQSLPVISAGMLDVLADHELDVPTEAALEAAIIARVPIYIRNVFNPSHPGTYVLTRHEDLPEEAQTIIITRRQIRMLTVSGDQIDVLAGQAALAAEHIPTLVGGAAPNQLLFFLRTEHANIARLVLSQAYPGAQLESDSSRSALVTLVGIDPGSAALVARHLDFPAQAVRIGGYSALIVDEGNIEVAVEKIHKLTLPQSK